MIRVNRRFLAWIVSVGLVCLGVVIAVRAIWPGMRAVWPGMVPSGGDFAAFSLAFPTLSTLPVVIGNIALSVVARRRGGRPASIGSVCLWAIGILVVLTLAVSLTPPAVVQSANSVLFVVVLLLLTIGASLPVQLLVLALLAFALIGSSRTPRTAGDMR
jgi:hypothetical protein